MISRLTLIISIIALILSVYNLLVILGITELKLEDVMITQKLQNDEMLRLMH